MTNLHQQIEIAFDYRGNVTLVLKNGERVEGFIFNRNVEQGNAAEQYVEVFLAGSGTYQKISVNDLSEVQLTGEDHAAGKSYQEWLEKQKAEAH